MAVACRLVARPARARALTRLAARGPAPRSRTAPIRERRRGAAAAHALVVVAPVAAHVVIPHRRHAATPRVAAAAATPTCVAIVTARVIAAHPNLAVVSRRAAYASPRASNLTSVTIVIVTNCLATRTTHVSMLARLAGAGAGRLTCSRVPYFTYSMCIQGAISSFSQPPSWRGLRTAGADACPLERAPRRAEARRT